ncbi:MAG: CHRD domain-containing protein [Rivularia sp. (in: Bacteria)]|nr:CHRD domain-containing protein [Rivularia sp. MS3]
MSDLIITGVIDGPLSGGVPKAIELYALNDIPDLSIYGLGSANNGGGSDGEEFTFPPDSLNAGEFIYVASEDTGFNDFFGFAPNYESSAASINGDDAIELFQNGTVVDVFGEINTDGTGQPWEYLDGWAYRTAGGPDTTFVSGNWSFSGANALDGETSNSSAANAFPIRSFGSTPGANFTITETDGNTEVDESGTTDTFDVALTTQPNSDVVINITSDDADEATFAPTSLTFTNSNWDTAQTVTVTGVDDDETDDSQTTTLTLSVDDDSSDDSFDEIADKTVSVTTTDDESIASLTPIYDIQGTAHTSPLLGESVTTTGIVTAVDSNGFYLQDATGDDNTATSDAIFVFTSDAPTVNVGDDVEVSGTVSEFFPGGQDTGNLSTTQISGSPTVTVNSSGNNLPEATIIGTGGRVPPTENIDDDAFTSFDPDTDGIDFFESLEAMRVTAQDAVAIAPTNRFGEIFTVVDNGENATGISDRGTLNISPDDFNPEKVQIDEDSDILPGFEIPEVDVGAKLGDVTGVVGYGFGNFEIYPTEDFTANVVESTLQPETTTIEGGADKLTVASYNVLNLDPVVEDSANTNSGNRDVDDDEGNGRFTKIASHIVDNLKTPDIIGLQEIQDNTGAEITDDVTSASDTLQKLVDEIKTAGGPEYEFIDNTFIGDETSGGQPGGNIRTAFLYNPERVGLVEGSVESIQEGDQQTNSENPFFDARLPIVAKFTFNGEQVTVVNNHFSSKGGSAPILGVEQPFEARQEEVAVNGSLDERQAQANAVKEYVDGILEENSNANVVVLGDLNEFEFVSPVETLSESLTNLTETVAENERYSFIFQGNSQSLDHILISDNLTTEAEFDIVHLNSEFAETTQKASDHDPLVASLSIRNQNTQNQNMINFAGTVELEGAEISAYDPENQRIFVTGEAGEDNANSIAEDSPILQVVDVSDPSNPTVVNQIDLSSYGDGVQSVAVKNGVVAVAVSAETVTDPGKVVFFNASDYSELSQVTVGALPDMLTFTPDGMKVLVANEGEPNDRYTVDPEGSISIIDVSDTSNPTVTTADFSAFNGEEDTLRSEGVRIFGERTNPDGSKTPATAAEDFEPEYIAVSPDGSKAFVTLQENNAIAIVDIASATVTDVKPLGYKDWSGNNPTLKPFKATLEGSQEVTANSSTATGSAFLQLNQAGDALTYTMTVEGLDFGTLAGGEAQTDDTGDDVTGIHFHNAARGEGGPVVFGIFGPAQDTDDRTVTVNDDGSTTISGVWETTDTEASESLSTFVADLQATNNDQDTNLYFNIHTEEFPSGEIRGQVMGASVELDASNRDGEDGDGDGDGDGAINFANYPNLQGMYQPDAIASYEVNGETYYITANEGDARIRPDGDIEDDDGNVLVEEGADFNEETRVGKLELDETAFPNASELQEDENLGRLKVTNTLGNTDDDDAFEELYAYGGRSFSIWDDSGNLVYDSGDLIGKLTAELVPELFNSQDGDTDEFDDRSDDKGAEPEGVTVGMVGDKTYAYVGLERTGGVMVFDVSNPTAASFVQYLNREEDIGPEGLTFINAEDSPNGNSLLAVTNEESETLSIYNAGSESTEPYTLQLLHAADQEAGIPALEDAPNFSAVLNALKNEDADSDGNADYENTLLLSSGDAYIPGIFLDASADESLAPLLGEEGRGRSDIIIQNELGFQAIALGNHEFDLGTEFIASVIAQDGEYPGANFPYLSANLDVSTDENLAPLVAEDGQEASTIPGQIAKSAIVTVNGEKIGVVGATTPNLASISSPGDVTISPENPEDIAALAAEIQNSVDALLADNPDLNKVVLISHMQQIAIEEELAGLLKNVDIIMAGGSNTLLSDDTDRLRDGDSSQGAYPILKTDADGKPVAVVNTGGNYRYVGRLVVDFDENGEIIADSIDPEVSGAYATDEAGVEAVNGTPDPEIVAITDALRDVITDLESNFFGVTDTFLNGTRGDVRTQETNLGNLTADANLAIAKQTDPDVVISIKNGGGIRDNIGRVVTPPGETEPEFLPPEGNELAGKPEGGISQVDIQDSLRFNNGLTLLTATAEELLAIIEHGVSESADGATPGRFPQVSGLKFSFDDDSPAGDRVESLAVVDEDGEIIDVVVQDGELQGDADRTFRLVTLGFLAGGGDGYPFPDRDVVELAQAEEAERTGEATFAPDGSEQDALAEFLATNFSEENPFSEEDVPVAQDMRIQNLDFREDTVLEGIVTEINTAEVDGTTVESIDLTAFTGQATINYTISREADFDNEVYFYEVDSVNGTVDGIAVGEEGYMEAALANIISPVFSTSDDNTETASAEFDAGSVVVPLIIADGTLAEALSGEADIYFPYLGANTDDGGFDHIKLLDDNTFGFEDLPNGGDEDFNDIKITINSIA